MRVSFDKFSRYRNPSILLCNPNEEELFSLADIRERVVVLRYNSISEFSFELSSKKENGEPIDYYELVKTNRIVKIDTIGQFVITSVSETDTGLYKTKSVSCKSLEYELSHKGISLAEGTYKFYDPMDNSKTIIGQVLSYLPNWRIGEIDENLWNLYRTFDVIEKNLYDFVINDVEEAYEALFVFDSLVKTISAYSIKTATQKTDIFISNKNVVKELNIEENSDELSTAINVYGADDLSIRSINPLGGAILYNFKYFKTKEWLDDALITALTNWENTYEAKKAEYSLTLATLKRLNRELLALEVRLSDLKKELTSLENIKAVRAEQGLSLTEINGQINSKENEIARADSDIKAKRTEIGNVSITQENIVKAVAFENFFTEEQYKILDRFIRISTYKNDTFVVTDAMDDVQKQEVLEGLYQVGLEVLERVSQPTYSFNVQAINFINLIDYRNFTQELNLGSEITLDLGDGRFAYPVLLELQLNYDDPMQLSLGFSNRLRLDKAEYTFAELFKETVETTGDVNFSKNKWGEGIKVKNQFNEFLNNSLNASLQDIINSDKQEVVIDGSGIHCKRFNDTLGTHDPEQVWITGKSILFSKDGFNTADLALGRVQLPDGTWSYGINAQVLMGKLVATNQLRVENEGGTFLVDANGVTIKNGNILMTNESGLDQTLEEVLSGIESSATGEITTDRLVGAISAGKNNIKIIDEVNTKALVMNEVGIQIANAKTSGNWNWKTAITADGIVADAIKANGTLTGQNIVGGTLNIGNGTFSVSNAGAVSASDLTITGGAINFANGKFKVESNGKVTASDISITGGSLNLNNLVMTGTISWSQLPSDVAGSGDILSQSQVENLAKSQLNNTFGITTTTIGKASIQSPSITGGTITGGTLYQDGNGGLLLSEGTIVLENNSKQPIGMIGYSDTYKMWIMSNSGSPMRIDSGGEMAISVPAGSKINLEGKVVVKGGEIVDEKGNSLVGGGSATFG